MNRGKYAYMGLWVKYALVKSSGVSKITPVQSKNRIITVSVFLSTLQLTALLLKKFRLRLHRYTLSITVTALHPTSFLCPSRRCGRDEQGELAT